MSSWSLLPSAGAFAFWFGLDDDDPAEPLEPGPPTASFFVCLLPQLPMISVKMDTDNGVAALFLFLQSCVTTMALRSRTRTTTFRSNQQPAPLAPAKVTGRDAMTMTTSVIANRDTAATARLIFGVLACRLIISYIPKEEAMPNDVARRPPRSIAAIAAGRRIVSSGRGRWWHQQAPSTARRGQQHVPTLPSW